LGGERGKKEYRTGDRGGHEISVVKVLAQVVKGEGTFQTWKKDN